VVAPKSAQKHKAMTNAFKLLFASRHLEADGRCILSFGDHEADSHSQGSSWMARCLREHGIEVKAVDMSPEVGAKVEQAQQRQYRKRWDCGLFWVSDRGPNGAASPITIYETSSPISTMLSGGSELLGWPDIVGETNS
jgi:hypothetical protein